MRRRLNPLVLMLAATLITIIAAGCGGASNQAGKGGGPVGYAENGTWTMAIPLDPGHFDIYHNNLIIGRSYLAYDSLVNLRPDGKFVSGLAQEWKVGAQSATFKLRPDVTCSDGTPLTARQVAAAITYVSKPQNQSPFYGLLVPTIPLTASGDDQSRTVRVVLKRPFGLLLNTVGQLPIVCAKGLADTDMLKTASDGTGPFVLTDVDPGQTFTFTRREGYTWGPDGASTAAPGTPSKVVLRIVPNETTSANLLLAGELNLAAIFSTDRERLDAAGLAKIEEPFSGAWLWFNQLGGRPTSDRRVREALVQALDFDQIVKINTGGAGGRATGAVPMTPNPCPGDSIANDVPPRDVERAGALLDQAGWKKDANNNRTKNGKVLTLGLNYVSEASYLNKPTAELIARDWEAIGVQVELRADSWAGWSKVMYETSDYDVEMQGLNINLPNQLVSYVTGDAPPQGSNIAGIDNPTYGEIAAKAAALPIPQACAYWRQAEQALYRDLNPVPIATSTRISYLQRAQAVVAGFQVPIPTSIRVLE